MTSSDRQLIEELKDKAYREAFVATHIDNGIAFQIRTIRKVNNWTQKDLGDKADMKQERISVLEDPNKINFNVDTLRRIASAFDVGLMIRFVPFSDLVKWDKDLSPESLQVTSFTEDTFFKEEENEELSLGSIGTKTVIDMQDFREKHHESSGLNEMLADKAQKGYLSRATGPSSMQQAIQGRR